MTTETTKNLQLTFLGQYQAQKELTVNENFNIIDLLLNRGVESYLKPIPENDVDYGSLFIVSDTEMTTLFKQYSKHLALFIDKWLFIKPAEGMLFWSNQEKVLIVYTNSEWKALKKQ